MRRHLLLLAGLALLAAAPAAAAPASRPPIAALTLSPTMSAGLAKPGRVLGPFALTNGTGVVYDVQVAAVMLGQTRTGGIAVLDDAASRRAAARMIGLQVSHFRLGAGQARSVAVVVKKVRRRDGAYVGVLFSGRPHARPAKGAQIINVLRLNASQFLAPRVARPAASIGAIRPEQAGRGRLRLQIPVANSGNVLAGVAGHVDVRDATGHRVLRARVKRAGVLPGMTVEIPVALHGRLGKGHYTLEARLAGKAIRLRGSATMDLAAVNTVPTEAARLTGFASPRARMGSRLEISGRFLNTGNQPYAPAARLEVERVDAHGAPVAPQSLKVANAGPGRQGRIGGSVTLPEGEAFKLTLRLMAGSRELDVQTVRVDVRQAPALSARVVGFLRTNAIAILLGAVAFSAGRVSRGRRTPRDRRRAVRAGSQLRHVGR
jgi:hypothetical protein